MKFGVLQIIQLLIEDIITSNNFVIGALYIFGLVSIALGLFNLLVVLLQTGFPSKKASLEIHTTVYWLVLGSSELALLYTFYKQKRLLPLQVALISILSISLISLAASYIPYFISTSRYKNSIRTNRLERLLEKYSPSESFLGSLTLVGILLFSLSLYYIGYFTSAISSFLMGSAILINVNHRYRADSAFLGLVLLSLGLTSAGVFCSFRFFVNYSVVSALNLIMLFLAVSSLLWIWLGRIWQGQFVDGKPITTTARLAPLTRHLGVMLLGFSCLAGLKISFWPIVPSVSSWDNSPERLWLVGISYGTLIISTYIIARLLKSYLLMILFVINIFCGIIAFVVRFPKTFEQYFLPNFEYAVLAFFLSLVIVTILYNRSHNHSYSGKHK